MDKEKAEGLFARLESMVIPDTEEPVLRVRLDATVTHNMAEGVDKRVWRVRCDPVVEGSRVPWQRIFNAGDTFGADAELQNAGVEFA